jgi:hypothetical protein
MQLLLLGLLFGFNASKHNLPCPIKPLTPELNPSAQHCLTRLSTGDFAS